MIPTNIFSLNIAHRSDGLHALLSDGGVYLWKNAGEVSHHEIPPFVHSEPSCDFAGNKFIMAENGGGNGPVMIAEMDLETFAFPPPFEFGNENNRQPIVKGLPSGGCIVTSYTMENAAAFDVAYQSPFTGQWSSFRHQHDFAGSIPSSNWVVTSGTDGLVYIFGMHDGGNFVMLFRFAEGMGGLVLVDSEPHYITNSPHNGVYDPLAPMAELPFFHAQTDKWRGRVVVAYQKFRYRWENGKIQSPTQIVAVYPNKSRELVGDIEVWSGHGNPAYVFARPDGIYYALTHNTDATEPADRFLFGGFIDKGIVQSPDNPFCHPFMAVSFDGWIMRRLFNPDWSYTFELGKLPLPPKLRIKDLGATAEVNWDQQTIDDVLESSTDLATWTSMHTGPPPVAVDKNGSSYFRVVQPNAN